MTLTSESRPVGVALIRDLNEEEFAARYGCDRYTATVLSNRFDYLVEHMSVRLLTGAFSPILRDFYDLACTISGPPSLGYQVPAASNGIVLMAGTTIDAVANMVEEFGADRLQPGDVLIANDPYRTGNHNNDLLFVRPVFHHGEIAAFVNLNAHQLDMGGTVPGGFSASKQNVYENGLVLSPRLLIRGGEPVAESWNVIFDNVRMAEILYPDMQTVCSSLELGERLVLESIERYGLGAVHGTMEYVCDLGAEHMSTSLAVLPDGDWTGSERIDCDGVDDSEDYTIEVAVRKRGSRIEVDFSGTSRQARSSINATSWDTKTSVGITLKYLFDPHGRFNSGLYRDVDIILPEGTMLSALPPDGCVFMYFEQSTAALSALLKALSAALGPAALAGDRGSTDIHTAFGTYENGTPWVSALQCGGEIGPYGANQFGDADSQCMSYLANGVAPAVEAIEKDSPAVILRHEPRIDSAGPGHFRGGASMIRDTLWILDASHSLTELRYKSVAGFGVNGGQDGRRGGIWMFPPAADGSFQEPDATIESFGQGEAWAGVIDAATNLPSETGTFIYPFRPGANRSVANSVLRYLTNAGGGWGNPMTRDTAKVLTDVRDGYVSVEGAALDYGVVLIGDPEMDPEGLKVDEAATARIREKKSQLASQVT
ncbi:hydantoinase B/oxoprolinase family protein [Arthrobacter sulfonylureivorans]|uniref:hydantoinase B/oxoprolinase family protein n=1 Tax=Arthrobacter TaxID=1663 RepID=UPI0010AC5FA0|nr:hydantoinase B/oxoprolinase family protein [Arthrobacter sp. CAU 1506]TJY66133.1 hydantoinase B/oxoprolinase family protein [Arthrobacter sp. CAU 1506]